MDAHSGVPLPPKGESPTNRQDRIRLTEPRRSRFTEAKPNRAGTGETSENRSDRLRETAVFGKSRCNTTSRKSLVTFEQRDQIKGHANGTKAARECASAQTINYTIFEENFRR